MGTLHQLKTKKRNVAGRRNPNFARMIQIITRDCAVPIEELLIKKLQKDPDAKPVHDEQGRLEVLGTERPDGVTFVEGLNGYFPLSDERMFRHIDTIAIAAKQFDDAFWGDEGLDIMALRRDRKNRVWADDNTILQFCYVLIGMNLAKWTYTRDKWKDLKSGMPHITFLGPKPGEKIDDTNNEVGENDESNIN